MLYCRFSTEKKLSGSDLLLRVFLCVLADVFWWSDAHLCRLEGLQTAPHGPLEDLLHLVFILVDVKVAPAVPVPVLQRTEQKTNRKEYENLF